MAVGEFSSSYNVKYNVDETGVTEVNERVTLKNNTDKFFPSSFALLISATNLENVEASDADGPLETAVEKLGKKSKITVKFTKQIGGKDKQYVFDLNFSSPDFVQKNGEVLTVSIPKIGQTEDIDAYALSVSVPVSFGDPSFITPEPRNESENAGKLVYSFAKDQLVESGVLGIFGTEQTFDFALQYGLNNGSFLQKVVSIGIPAPGKSQEILIKNIEPKPLQVSLDEDGNYRAFFKLERLQKQEVTVSGLATVKVASDKGFAPLSKSQTAKLTLNQNFWDAGSPQIRSKANGLIDNEQDQTNAQKMRKLYKYVVSALQFDSIRYSENNFQRYGSLTAMANPDKALSAEYTDLLIALARSIGIPTRQVIGVAFSNNLELRPLSFEGSNLHAWVEYFDEEGSWKAVDPTWESTSGGVDYFSQSSINHLAVVRRGVSSSEPLSPQDAVITFTDQKPAPTKNIQVYLEVKDTLFSGFPQQAELRIENNGDGVLPKETMTLSSKRIQFVGEDERSSLAGKKGQNQISIQVDEIPPFGNFELLLDVKTGTVSESYTDFVLVGFDDQVFYKEVDVIPFYKSPILLFSSLAIGAVMLAFYVMVLGLHLRIGHDGIKFVIYKPHKSHPE